LLQRNELSCHDKGVDFGGTHVDHVIVFDFPKDPAEYIRRVGRTARAGRTGLCTVFAYGWQLPIARQIILDKQHSIVDSNLSDGGGGGTTTKKYFDIFATGRNNNDVMEAFGSSNNYLEQELQQSKSTNNSQQSKMLRSHNQDLLAGSIASGKLWRNRTFLPLDQSEY
jgi:superfamily II DNA/RNA helicase